MTTVPTVAQANNLFQLGKWILGFLGILIAGVFWGTYYGTSYIKDNTHSIYVVSRDLKELNTSFTEFKSNTKDDIKDLKQGQVDMQSQIQYLLDHCPKPPTGLIRFRTEHKNSPNATPTIH